MSEMKRKKKRTCGFHCHNIPNHFCVPRILFLLLDKNKRNDYVRNFVEPFPEVLERRREEARERRERAPGRVCIDLNMKDEATLNRAIIATTVGSRGLANPVH